MQHRREPVDGVGHDAGAGGQVRRQGEVGPEGQRHAVEEDERAGRLVRRSTRRADVADGGRGGGHGYRVDS